MKKLQILNSKGLSDSQVRQLFNKCEVTDVNGISNSDVGLDLDCTQFIPGGVTGFRINDLSGNFNDVVNGKYIPIYGTRNLTNYYTS